MTDRKKYISYISISFVLIVTIFSIVSNSYQKEEKSIENKKLNGTILAVNNDKVTIRENNLIFTLNIDEKDLEIGDKITIEYTGLLDKNKESQNITIINYTTKESTKEVFDNLENEGIFSNYYALANNKLKTLSLEEKIGQLILARYPDKNAKEDLEKYNLAGYVFFEKDFKDKTKQEVIDMIDELQEIAKIPILTAVDEEGGKVVRVSSNSNLIESKFPSPKELYTSGGFEAIKEDTINKSNLLSSLGLNLNLAPVVDVSTNPNDYMYERTIGESTDITKEYAKIVIESSKSSDVSYTLKHFPGYGNNGDTHTSSTTDNRTYDDILNNDIPPFESGINAGAEAVLVSHNIISSIDPDNPASLSTSVHNLLRNELNFTGVVITDDLAMGAVSSISDNTVKALLAGNDLIITTNYKESIDSIKESVNSGTISEEHINTLAFRVLSWKYYKGLMFNEK